jgi:hypothetical protein
MIISGRFFSHGNLFLLLNLSTIVEQAIKIAARPLLKK